jgi:DNA-directed RNA polymerase specialized sigma24 family protein
MSEHCGPLERLVEQYARLIWFIAVEFELAESDAADVTQTTWLRLLEHIDRIEYPDRIGSWLAGDRPARVPALPGSA